MAKFKHSIRIRIGAAHDDVQISTGQDTLFFDRAALERQRHEGPAEGRMQAKATLYGLRKGVIDSFVELQERRTAKAKQRHRSANQNERRMQKEQIYA